MDIYAENILDHSRNPRNSRGLHNATVEHEEKNHSCGDVLHVWLMIEDDVVKSIGWQGEGCAISQASMSILSEILVGMHADEILQMKKGDIYKLLGVPIGPRRFKCSLMSLHTIKNALHKAKDERLQSWVETVELANEEG